MKDNFFAQTYLYYYFKPYVILNYVDFFVPMVNYLNFPCQFVPEFCKAHIFFAVYSANVNGEINEFTYEYTAKLEKKRIVKLNPNIYLEKSACNLDFS